MRNMTILFALIFATLNTFAQVDCNPYVPQAEGSKWEITNYNKKGKKTGRSTFELLGKATEGNQTTFTIASVAYDKKDKVIFDNTFEAKCTDGKFHFNMAMKLNGQMMENYKNTEVEVDASDLEIPDFDASAGTEMDDGTMTVTMNSDSPINMNLTVKITDRKVEGKEKVTTPAGTFDCMIMTQKVKTKMMVNIKSSSKDWYAKDIGMVRSETYNKRGKMTGYSELTKLEGN